MANKDESKTEAITLPTDLGDLSPQTDAPPCLVLVHGPPNYIGRQWTLHKTVTTVGRMAGSDICLEEGGLSKNHARLTSNGIEISITDLGATNKTIVNGQALLPNKAYVLKNNDQIRTGSLMFKFLFRGILSETAEKERMQSELESARKVQASLLPSKASVIYGPARIAGHSISASEMGGDWWWHWTCGDRAFVMIGDVTGHGAGAALLTSAARSAIATMEDDPAVDVERLYTMLCRAIEKCAGGSMSMSAFLVEINLQTKVLRNINASHLPAVILPKKDEGAAVGFSGGENSSALGAVNPKIYVEQLQSEPGMRIVLMTDGLTERSNPKGDVMSERAFFKMLFEAHSANYADQKAFLDSLMAKSKTFAAGAALKDDLTVVVLDF